MYRNSVLFLALREIKLKIDFCLGFELRSCNYFWLFGYTIVINLKLDSWWFFCCVIEYLGCVYVYVFFSVYSVRNKIENWINSFFFFFFFYHYILHVYFFIRLFSRCFTISEFCKKEFLSLLILILFYRKEELQISKFIPRELG